MRIVNNLSCLKNVFFPIACLMAHCHYPLALANPKGSACFAWWRNCVRIRYPSRKCKQSINPSQIMQQNNFPAHCPSHSSLVIFLSNSWPFSSATTISTCYSGTRASCSSWLLIKGTTRRKAWCGKGWTGRCVDGPPQHLQVTLI